MPQDNKTDIWMPLYIGDYLADTAHLTAEQSGAYLHLIMHYWRNGPLVNDDTELGMIAKLSGSAWSTAWKKLKKFFKLQDDGLLHQSRIDHELERWADKRLKAKEKSSKGGLALKKKREEKSASSTPQALPNVVLNECPSSSPSHIKQIPHNPPTLPQKTKPTTVVEVGSDYDVLTRVIGEQCGLFTAKARSSISDVCRTELATGRDPEELGRSMVQAWKEYKSGKVNYTTGAERFFGEGIWKNRSTWQYKDGTVPESTVRKATAVEALIAREAMLAEKDRLEQLAMTPEKEAEEERQHKREVALLRIKNELRAKNRNWSNFQVNAEAEKALAQREME